MIKINWKIRFKNPLFLFQLFCAWICPVLAYSGLSWNDITSWDCLISILLKSVQNPVVLVSVFASIANAVIDPTTKGLGDGINALNYTRPM